MGKRSVKEDKTIYQETREENGLSRAAAAELLECISESRIEKSSPSQVRITSTLWVSGREYVHLVSGNPCRMANITDQNLKEASLLALPILALVPVLGNHLFFAKHYST